MNSSIRIIKPKVKDELENSQPEKDGPPARQNKSEIVMTIKGWIAERQQRSLIEERIDIRLWQADPANLGP